MDENRRKLLGILAPVTSEISGVSWDSELMERLNHQFSPESDLFRALTDCCQDGIESGWMGLQGEEKRKGARVIEAGTETNGMSIDVVQLVDFTGPHHRHPNGEVCAIMTAGPDDTFDDQPEGWAVYPPGSEHWPAGKGGRVRVLFFLPGGEIEYTDREASLSSGTAGGTD